MHVPGFASADAATEALKARANAVLKREEAVAVRFLGCNQFAFRDSFFIHDAGSCHCYQFPIACLGSGRMESQQQRLNPC